MPYVLRSLIITSCFPISNLLFVLRLKNFHLLIWIQQRPFSNFHTNLHKDKELQWWIFCVVWKIFINSFLWQNFFHRNKTFLIFTKKIAFFLKSSVTTKVVFLHIFKKQSQKEKKVFENESYFFKWDKVRICHF